MTVTETARAVGVFKRDFETGEMIPIDVTGYALVFGTGAGLVQVYLEDGAVIICPADAFELNVRPSGDDLNVTVDGVQDQPHPGELCKCGEPAARVVVWKSRGRVGSCERRHWDPESADYLPAGQQPTSSTPLEFGVDRNGDEIPLNAHGMSIDDLTGAEVDDIAAGDWCPTTVEACGEIGVVLAKAIVDLRTQPVKCPGCTFSDEPWHDLFLTLETSGEPWVFLFRNLEMTTGPEGFSDVAAFIRTHNWDWPEAMEHVAQLMVIAECKGARW